MRKPVLLLWAVLQCFLIQQTHQLIQEHSINFGNAEESANKPKRLVGYFRLNSTYAGNMFYWFFESRNPDPDVPVVLWIHGGPGCSSALAIFYESGPFRITDDLELSDADWSWDLNHHVIYVDQPMNTGFSYSEDKRDTVYDEKTLAEDMLEFLEEFFLAHPNLQGKDFYITGVSYAGHMVPNIATGLRQAIVDNKLSVDISFVGIALGNPWINPQVQYAYYAQYAYEHGLITYDKKTQIENEGVPMCHTVINNCFQLQSREYCPRGVNLCGDATVGAVTRMNPGINVYDIRKPCIGSLCYDFTNLIRWINEDAVREALGAESSWNGPCSSQAHSALMGDWLYHYDWMLGPLLDDGIRVMIYAGMQDLLCCHHGQEAWLKDLDWDGRQQWNEAVPEPLLVNMKAMGKVKTYGLLSYVTIDDAGHEAPMDQPETCWHLYTRFTRNLNLTEEGQYEIPPLSETQPSLHNPSSYSSDILPITAAHQVSILG